jgi:hypothetical protein
MSASRASGKPPAGSESDVVQRFVRSGLELAGIEAGEDEVAVMLAADALYRPLFEALLAAELDGIEAEPGADMSRPPR